MRKITQLLTLCLLINLLCADYFMLYAADDEPRTVMQPVVARASSEYLNIYSVEVSESKTVVTFEITCMDESGYEFVSPPSAGALLMRIGTRENFVLKAAEGTHFGTIKCDMMSVKYASFVFEPLPKDTQFFSVSGGAEGEGSEFSFEDVLLYDLEEAEALAQTDYPYFQIILGQHYQREYDYEKAQQYLNMYAESISKEKGDASKEYLEALNYLIQLNLSIGNYEDAEEIALQTVATLGENNPMVADILYTLGDVYQVLGNHQDAVSTYIDYLRKREMDKQPKPSEYSTINNLVAYSFASMEDTTSRVPVAVGVHFDLPKLKGGTAQMRVFAVGATHFKMSEKENFEGADWKEYEAAMDITHKPAVDTQKIYFHFKDEKDNKSDVFEVDIAKRKK
ncbi:MAG: tetratricopeptide repeat protein [Bernardetiaceae bacterium]|nr:tetratricopeptide repeat protein [Bernardetiaceae bacterium]